MNGGRVSKTWLLTGKVPLLHTFNIIELIVGYTKEY